MTRRAWSYLGAAVLLVAAGTVPLLITGTGTSAAQQTSAKAGVSRRPPVAAKYDTQNRLIRPQDHHEWIFVGAPVTPNDMNDGKAAFPEFHNVYIDPASFANYKQTGKFAEGTVILKELVAVGGKQMDSGNGYFQGEFNGLEAMVKDSKRFPEEPGGWVFFRFGEAPHYKPVGDRMQTESCNGCHSGANEDFVFTDTYPVLRAAKAKLK